MVRTQTARRRYQSVLEFSRSFDQGIDFSTDEWEESYSDTDLLSPDNGVIEGDVDIRVQKTESGIEYYITLPAGTKRCKVYTQFYKLKSGAKTWKKENVILKIGMYFLIYSPDAKKYYLRQVYDGFNPERVKQYIRDKNLYLIES